MHKLGLYGLQKVLPAVGRFLVENTKFALGLAILENADDLPAEIVAVEPETIFDVEPRLLDRARDLMGRLPFDQIDVLIVGELGKNYSGAGMDPNVIGRLMVETQPDFDRPVVTRLAVLDASEESHGNIVGIGFADLTTERLVSKMDPDAVPDQRADRLLPRARAGSRSPCRPTATSSRRRSTPAGGSTRSTARLVVIPNTLELKTLWVSPALEDEVRDHPHLTRETDYRADPVLARRLARPGVALPRERPGPPGGGGVCRALRPWVHRRLLLLEQFRYFSNSRIDAAARARYRHLVVLIN